MSGRMIHVGDRIRKIGVSVPDKIYIVQGWTKRGKMILSLEHRPDSLRTTWWTDESSLPRTYVLDREVPA